MSTIPTFFSTDRGSTVKTKLETALSNLNTDKIEADTTVTMTNKTLTSPVINTPSITGGTQSSPTINTPTINTPTINTPTINTPTITGWDGWETVSGTWTATSGTGISVNADVTSYFQKGDKLKLTNNSSIKYFYVTTTPSFAAGATTFIVTGEVDLVSGSITLPFYSKIDNPQGFKKGENWYKARAYRGTSNQVVTSGGFTKIQLNAENWDPNSNFDSATNFRYTAPISGYYAVNGRVFSDGTAAARVISCLYVNGTEISRGTDLYTGKAYGSNLSDNIFLNKGDYVELYTYLLSDDTLSRNFVFASIYNFLSVQFVSV